MRAVMLNKALHATLYNGVLGAVEISIRKTFGFTVLYEITLLSKHFLFIYSMGSEYNLIRVRKRHLTISCPKSYTILSIRAIWICADRKRIFIYTGDCSDTKNSKFTASEVSAKMYLRNGWPLSNCLLQPPWLNSCIIDLSFSHLAQQNPSEQPRWTTATTRSCWVYLNTWLAYRYIQLLCFVEKLFIVWTNTPWRCSTRKI